MKRFVTTVTAAAIATVVLTAPSYAGTSISADLWDAGDDMVMVDNLKLADHPDLANAPMGIKLSLTTVPAGEVTFEVTNSSSDIQHELIVANLAGYENGVPYSEDNGRVKEDAPGMNLAETHRFDAGGFKTLTLTLEPGRYLIYCNIAAHYASGMWEILTVE